MMCYHALVRGALCGVSDKSVNAHKCEMGQVMKRAHSVPLQQWCEAQTPLEHQQRYNCHSGTTRNTTVPSDPDPSESYSPKANEGKFVSSCVQNCHTVSKNSRKSCPTECKLCQPATPEAQQHSSTNNCARVVVIHHVKYSACKARHFHSQRIDEVLHVQHV